MSAVNRQDSLGIWINAASTEGDDKVPSYYVCHFVHMIFKSKVTMADWTLNGAKKDVKADHALCSLALGVC
jgi:hypothetical protein